MLDTKNQALLKMNLLITLDDVYYFDRSLRWGYRYQKCDLLRRFKENPKKEIAVDMCIKFDLIRKNVDEVDDYGETPLFTACSDGVVDEDLELLLQAGCDVNFKDSWVRLH